jgi:hypothetical protein
MAGGKANGLISNILNATLPTAAGGKPAAFTNYATASAMTMRLNSTLSTASAAGTELPNGSGYVTNGTALGASTASSGGSAVTLPAALTSWTNGSGGAWTIESTDILDSSQTRGWWGPWNGQPISIAIGNTFSVAANAVSASDA